VLLILAGCIGIVVSANVGLSVISPFRDVIEPTQAQLVTQTGQLETVLPLFARLGLSTYETDNACLYLEDGRGIFTDSPGDSCDLQPDLARPFDAQATADMDAIRAAFAATGLQIADAWATEDPGEAPGFAFSGHCPSCAWMTFVYAPGYGVLPADMPGHAHFIAISADWFAWEGPG
jgi:hypothetical protein